MRAGLRVTVGPLAVSLAAGLMLPISALLTDASAAESGPTRGPRGVALTRGTIPGTVQLASKRHRPLAIVSMSVGGKDISKNVLRRGTDFSDATVWLRMHAGALCWRETPTVMTSSYTVRPVRIPFRAPAAKWRYSTIIAIGGGAPVIARSANPGDVITTPGQLRRVIVCVDVPKDVRTAGRLGLFADATPSQTAVASPASPSAAPLPLPLLPASPTTASTVPPTPSPSATTSPSQQPSAVGNGNGNGGDKKVTICHATSSESNPYSLISVSTNAALNGHGGHTGPLYPEPGWGDVIPPFDDYPGLNWPAGSQLVADGCTPAKPEAPVDPPGIAIEPPNPVEPMPPVSPPMLVRPPLGSVPKVPAHLTPTPLTPSVNPTTSGPSGSPTTSLVPVPSRPPSASPSVPIATALPRPTVSGATETPSTAVPGTSETPGPPNPGSTGNPPPTAAPIILPTPEDPGTETKPVPRDRVVIVLTNGWETFTITRPVEQLQLLAGLLPAATCEQRSLPLGDVVEC